MWRKYRVIVEHPVYIKEGDNRSQEFLEGHTNRVSCLCLSKDGQYLATGQVNYMGFTADIIIWDVEARKLIHRLSLHKAMEALSFSCDANYLASVGGQDDGKLVVWNVRTGRAVCGSPVPVDYAQTVKFFNTTEDKLVTAGGMKIVVWEFDVAMRLLRPTEANFGKLRRTMLSIVIDGNDEFVYAGTLSGDILQVSLGPKVFRHNGPKAKIEMGILHCAVAPTGDLLVGGGDGTITLVKAESLKCVCSTKLEGAVTSIVAAFNSLKSGSFDFYAGTTVCNLYFIRYDAKRNSMQVQVIHTSHYDKIYDIAFPSGYSEVFATCSYEDIRLWHLSQGHELLRIKVPHQTCYCVAFMPDGKSIISGWSDGRIRAYGPQSGNLLYTILDAHVFGVTSVYGTSDSGRIISGGKEGQVRVWKIGPQSHWMISNMKEHKAQVNSIQVRKNDSECVSSSDDGSCVVWDLTRFTRNNSFFGSTFFKAVLYHPDESQLLTTGTDRKITYWDAFDCSPIRVVDGSLSAEMYSIDISPDGMAFVSGGADREVKLWNYDEGHCYFVGHGHSEPITKVKISPDQHHVVSVGGEGAIFIWDYKSPVSASTSPAANTSPASSSPVPAGDCVSPIPGLNSPPTSPVPYPPPTSPVHTAGSPVPSC
ncbi:hypothetical protein L7F22_051643 [Adiantum nelumboides]|nr:hypothetical protein [Adiantum nelumboides]